MMMRLKYFDMAIEIYPDYVAAYNNRGIAKHDLKDYDNAIADYNRAIEIAPDYVAAYNNRGATKYALKRLSRCDCRL